MTAFCRLAKFGPLGWNLEIWFPEDLWRPLLETFNWTTLNYYVIEYQAQSEQSGGDINGVHL